MASATAQASFQTKGGMGNHAMLGSQPIKGAFGLAKANGYSSSTTAAQVAANWDGSSKVVKITGASAGLGLESAKVLAVRGAEVILAVRNPAKAQKALEAVKAAAGPNAKVSSIALDLNSLASVKACAQEYKASARKLHILLNNAGIMAPPFGLSKDGFEQQFATNHLGHFLLTKLSDGEKKS